MTVAWAPPPFRIAFDNARDPYTARNALGIAGTGAGLITSVTSPLAITGGNLTIDLSGYQSLAGVTDGSNAAAGVIGEYIEASTASTGVLTPSTWQTAVTIALSAGDWDVCGGVAFSVAAGTGVVQGYICTGTSLGSGAPIGSLVSFNTHDAWVQTAGLVVASGMHRFSLAAPATVYLQMISFYTGTMSITGSHVRARRVR